MTAMQSEAPSLSLGGNFEEWACRKDEGDSKEADASAETPALILGKELTSDCEVTDGASSESVSIKFKNWYIQ